VIGMDYPLQRRKPTWKDSLYFTITVNALAACGIVIVAVPLVLIAVQSTADLPLTLRVSMWDVFKTTAQFVSLWGLPYLWMSFLAIERARMRFGEPLL
jgi:hypothetical protein